MADNLTVIRDFIAAWSRLNPEELAAFFTEDGIYHNIPLAPVQGRTALHQFIAGFISDWTATNWEIGAIFAAGDVVIAERIDRTTAHGRHIELPCCGVFELRDGKIAVWRDYFDLATYTRAISG